MRSRREFLKLGTIGTALGCSPFIFNIINTEAFFGLGDPGKFLKACAEGKVELVEKMLAKDSNLLAAKDNKGRSGFALALLAGHRAVGELLKKSGYATDLHESVLDLDWERYGVLVGEESEKTVRQINADHPVGGSTIWAAAAGGAGTDVWRVYAKCGDPNYFAKKDKGTSPLQIALRFPDLKVAEMTAASLLSNDANPNLFGGGDYSPLHVAAERGSYEIVEMLIRLGADVEKKNRNSLLARQLAEKNGHRKVWELLKNHQQVPRICRTSRAAYNADGKAYNPPDFSDIPLYKRRNLVGLAHRNFEGVKKAVDADPRIVHSIATTSEKAVEASAHMGQKKLVEYLLEKGAPYSLPTAVMFNDISTVKRLLDEDPDRIHERGAHDFAPLWFPVLGGGNIEMMQLLLDRGAKIEEQHFLGTTALHWACLRAPIELVELLVENGADVNRVGRKFRASGQRPLQMVKDEKVANYLKSKGAK